MNVDLGGQESGWLIVEDGFAAALANTCETLSGGTCSRPRTSTPASRSATPGNWPPWPDASGSPPVRSKDGSPGPSRSACPPGTTTG